MPDTTYILGYRGEQDRPPSREDLMRRIGIEALYRRPHMTKPEPGHRVYPYLLRGKEITRSKGDGHHVHPDGTWLRLSRCLCSTGHPADLKMMLSCAANRFPEEPPYFICAGERWARFGALLG
jgi:hypothetical protein